MPMEALQITSMATVHSWQIFGAAVYRECHAKFTEYYTEH